MSIINAAITAVGGYLPEDKITNADLEKMVDTNNEWIMTRVGIRERRILKDPTKGASFLGIEAVKDLFSRNNIDPATIDGIIVATNTADYHFPTTASIVAFETGCINAFTFDMQAACPSFIYALEAGANYIRSGRYKRIIVLAAEKMTAITDYTDRATCPLFGDGAACVLLEPTEENEGVLDSYFRTDGTGRTNLIMKSGGSANPPSHETVDAVSTSSIRRVLRSSSRLSRACPPAAAPSWSATDSAMTTSLGSSPTRLTSASSTP